MPKKKSESNQLNDWKGFYEEFQNEIPRAAVIIATAFLDGWLHQLLANFTADDSKVVDDLVDTNDNPDCPLLSFAPRIEAAYCLGLISKDEYDNLNFIRIMRNRFAHGQHDLSFDNEQIVSWCNALQTAKMITDAMANFPEVSSGYVLNWHINAG